MDAQTLILRYRERLAWSFEETQSMLARYIEARGLEEDLEQFLVDETGLALTEDARATGYRGHPFCVLAFSGASEDDEPEERIDTDSEVLALEAFSELLSRPDLDRFVVVQFQPSDGASRELLRYDRRTSVQEW